MKNIELDNHQARTFSHRTGGKLVFIIYIHNILKHRGISTTIIKHYFVKYIIYTGQTNLLV